MCMEMEGARDFERVKCWRRKLLICRLKSKKETTRREFGLLFGLGREPCGCGIECGLSVKGTLQLLGFV